MTWSQVSGKLDVHPIAGASEHVMPDPAPAGLGADLMATWQSSVQAAVAAQVADREIEVRLEVKV
jgi:hypothetical protein